ncbi:MAG: hypothetical protein CMP91_07620 [Gammaproteobacteria bacterium]|nr:hypothetical protein [Gammaproteobacteria bacterium]|tara:strand:+ start:146625 stop:147671 length:1047 start_codon:yes stop_codon:yes gene_type:complete
MNPLRYFQALLRRLRRRKISDEAYEWFGILYSGDLTDREFERFLDWAEKNPGKASQLKQLEITWNKIPKYSREEEANGNFIPTLQELIFSNTYARLVSGTMAVLVLAAIIIFYNTDRSSNSIFFETARAETNSINLADGSLVTLNVLSRIEVIYSPDERRIRLLEGEAYFKVAPDKSRPFVVSTDNGTVQALGTEFNTRLSGNESFSVTLLEGSIKVSTQESGQRNSEAVLDQPGLQARITSNSLTARNNPVTGASNPIQIASVDVNNIISWQQGRLVFAGESLSTAIDIINSHTTHTIHLQAPELSQNPVYGVFNTGDWEGFLSAVESSYPLRHFDAGQDITVLSTN